MLLAQSGALPWSLGQLRDGQEKLLFFSVQVPPQVVQEILAQLLQDGEKAGSGLLLSLDPVQDVLQGSDLADQECVIFSDWLHRGTDLFSGHGLCSSPSGGWLPQ
jgi:hypothetical protein